MSKQANPTLIGSLVIGAIAIVVFTLLALGNITLNNKTYRCVLYFPGSLHGLDIGAPVAYRGVTVGKVGDIAIAFDPMENRYTIPVYIDIEGQTGKGTTHFEEAGFDTPQEFFQALISRGLRAKLKLRSIVTGKLYIEFFFAPDTEEKIVGKDTEYVEIPTLPSGLEQFTQALEELPLKDLVAKIMSALDNINQLVGSEELKQTIPHVNRVLVRADSLLLSFENQVPELVLELKQAIAQFSRLTTSTQELIEQTDSELTPLLTEIKTSFVKINTTLDQLLPIAENLTEMTDKKSSLRYDVNKALLEISQAAQSVNQLSDYLHRHPEALLTGRKEIQ